jgi:hypothetical protein
MNEYEDQYKLCKDDNDCSNGDQCGTIIMNPNNNVLNYDTFLFSLMYQTCTLEGWTEIMQGLQNTIDMYLWIF